ncbi:MULTISPECIES: SDR family NAD(P)-dependent oxidoreductase [unclassified Paenibacillus]|uniref:SDR family oxidoreductase n=1 Tax=unclassified Paenibacillus TaxID=185978 RepID=UPI001AE80E27|nr:MULTISPECIES: SDR family NAD(P)-dependent oxidoreductase [unclassified Paenibacillus]MBP1153627.1 NAD(P)-dependent dehydrogenase (short-subunit alcohol dehydrogenase family) [Paenibacillus sp. PvP091]MBP1170988.1 NAD(P)-dependent dehydrogenase (short-subunit alcohol dehydrogenase family) [Paenibacillus sp. PvR098]MBP2442016.1 NAD(P)-dependent dehydrogenase (short-subunit alcohol dehydrogenase family) [Paenibacillus sp. PvP052]
MNTNPVQSGVGKDRRMEGQVALVTGGGSGIGKASALLLSEHGAKVCILGRTAEELDETKKQIEARGGEAMAVVADISVPSDMEAAVKQTVNHWGRLDVVCANAGINGVMTSIEDMEVDDWQQVVDINLRGTFLTVKYAVPYMKTSGGSIIITSSINGNRVFSNLGFSTYSTTKAGQVAFMKMAALELAQYRIRVNAICPGAIETNIDDSTHKRPALEEIRIPVEFPEGDQPLARGPGSSEQVADLVLFLAGKASSHISGTEIYIDGAESLLRG